MILLGESLVGRTKNIWSVMNLQYSKILDLYIYTKQIYTVPGASVGVSATESSRIKPCDLITTLGITNSYQAIVCMQLLEYFHGHFQDAAGGRRHPPPLPWWVRRKLHHQEEHPQLVRAPEEAELAAAQLGFRARLDLPGGCLV